jgi:hypothetical protein
MLGNRGRELDLADVGGIDLQGDREVPQRAAGAERLDSASAKQPP